MWLAAALGLFAYVIALAMNYEADSDLWAKLAIGAEARITGHIPHADRFAFTPTLPDYMDHEWGSGVAFDATLRAMGPAGLMLLKIALAVGGLLAAMLVARRAGARWTAMLLIAPLAAGAMLPGFMSSVRSQAFTYLLFPVAILLLDALRARRRHPFLALPVLMVIWTNLHGGFAAGLGTIFLYALNACLPFDGEPGSAPDGTPRPVRRLQWIALALACVAATLLNPWGWRFWPTILHALTHPRPQITEWLPLPLWRIDPFIGTRLALASGVILLIVALALRGGRVLASPSTWMLLVTAVLTLRSRRHGPLFGAMLMAAGAPLAEIMLARLFRGSVVLARQAPRVIAVGYALLAFAAAALWLPRASWRVEATEAFFPLTACDLLAQAGVSGNAVTPFHWGSYVAWRNYPAIKISMDGRYEAVYPEEVFLMHQDFYQLEGDWDRLLRQFKVDFIFVHEPLNNIPPEALAARGFERAWGNGEQSLWSTSAHAARLRAAIDRLPREFPESLDADIPLKWFPTAAR